MDIRYAVSPLEYRSMGSAELRDAFLIDVFKAGAFSMTYCEVERTVVGGVMPLGEPLALAASAELATDFFCERRELGVINLGGAGSVRVDGEVFELDRLEALYVGRGAENIVFASASVAAPAAFYLVSYPAHQAYPTVKITRAEANRVELGSLVEANARTIYQYIHERGVQSCQLVMGVTALGEGSVWNTMPCHTHMRRSEVYLYFDLDEVGRVFHFMGPGEETRHLVVANRQAVLSPPWSIHCGCGTQAYHFCWAMGGENQRFDDMDAVPWDAMR